MNDDSTNTIFDQQLEHNKLELKFMLILKEKFYGEMLSLDYTSMVRQNDQYL